MLRWFPPDDIGYRDFGFNVYWANVGDVLPLRSSCASGPGRAGITAMCGYYERAPLDGIGG
jgi:hypothetical protein